MKRTTTALMIILSLSQTAFAKGQNCDCSHLHIEIANLTSNACSITALSVNHGNAITYPSGIIKPNKSTTFAMEQTIIGPEVTLSYQCGEDNITFTSKQDLCLLEAGKIKGTLHEPEPISTKVSFTKIEGSFLWRTPGVIYWTITNK